MKKARILSVFMATLITVVGVTNISAAATTESEQQFEKSTNEVFLSEEDVFEALAYTFKDKNFFKNL